MFRFKTTKQVLFERKRVHLLQLKRLQLISEWSAGRELLCGTFLSVQESTLFQQKKRMNIIKRCKKIVGRIYKSNTILRSKPSEWHGKPPLPWGEREEIVSPEQAILSCWTCFSISKGSWNKFRMTDNDKMAKWKNTSFWGASRRIHIKSIEILRSQTPSEWHEKIPSPLRGEGRNC